MDTIKIIMAISLAYIYMDLRNVSSPISTSGHRWGEMGAGRSLSHWISESAVNLQPIKMLVLSTELFSVLTQSGWSFALRIGIIRGFNSPLCFI